MRRPLCQACSALVCWHAGVWHVRTYYATLRSWPTQKARLFTQSAPQAAHHGTRGTPVHTHCRQRRCRASPGQFASPWPSRYSRQHNTTNVPPGGVREALRTAVPCWSTGLPSVAANLKQLHPDYVDVYTFFIQLCPDRLPLQSSQ